MEQREEEQRVRNKANSLANLLTALQSVACLYPTRRARRGWLERVFHDMKFDEIVRTYTSDTDLLPSLRSAVVEFCLGNIGVRTFSERLRTSFQGRQRDVDNHGPSVSKRLRTQMARETASDVNTTSSDSDSEESNNDGLSAAIDDQPEILSDGAAAVFYGTPQIELFWLALNERLRKLTITGGTTNDGYDARIEFARRFTVELSNGSEGQHATTPNLDPERDRLVCYADFVDKLVTVGFLDRSVVNYETTVERSAPVVTTDNATYPVYLFGSNCIWIRSDAMYTLPSETSVPAIFEDDTEIRSFVEHLLLYTGGTFVPDQDACRLAAVERNSVIITSFSRNDTSLRLVFAMPDSRLYTANVFYLKGGHTCSTDMQYKREYLSNTCQCENRLSQWRFFVSVAVLDGVGTDITICEEMLAFVNSMIRAFHRTKDDQGAHMYINHFTGFALINYTNDSDALGGMKEGVNIAEGNTSAENCYLHRWLRGHMNTEYWSLTQAPRCVSTLLLRIPQLLVVYRPLFSETVTAANGPNLFVNYKTFDDVVVKYVLLSLDTLRNGYRNRTKAVAYKSSDSYWIYADRKRVNKNEGCTSKGDTSTAWMRNADRFATLSSASSDSISSSNSDNGDLQDVGAAGSELFLDPCLDVLALFNRVYSAPSRLYVHSNVLMKLGFNVTAVSGGVPARTFTHTDRDTGHQCTVICSSPIVVVDETTNRPLETQDGVQMLRILKDSQEFDSALEKNRDTWDVDTASAYEERSVSLNDFWPGVRAVQISFKERVLENVHFVFFASADGCDSLRHLTHKSLTRLSRFNTQSPHILPPPVLYTLQQIFVHMTDGMLHTSSTSSPGVENGF